MNKKNSFLFSASLLIALLGMMLMSVKVQAGNTALQAGREMGLYNHNTGATVHDIPKISSREIFGDVFVDGVENTTRAIGDTMRNAGEAVGNAARATGNFFTGIFSDNPPTPIQQDLHDSLNFGNTVSTSVYINVGKEITNYLTHDPYFGKNFSENVGFLGDAVTVGSDIADSFRGGTTGYDSDTMNFIGDGLTGIHDAFVIDKYVAYANGQAAAGQNLDKAGFYLGLGKEIVKSKTAQDLTNRLMDKYGNPFLIPDAMIRMDQTHVGHAILSGADFDSIKGYILYGNKRDGYMNNYINGLFFTSDAKNQSQNIQYWRKKAAQARAKNQGQMNQRGKRNINEGKPVIYLYPEEITQVRVTFAYPDELTEVIPEYPGEWIVTAQPDGTICAADGENYPYLFYESETPFYFFQREEGFFLPVENRDQVMKEILLSYGLTESEADEFVEYWDEYLEEDVVYRMYPQLNEIADEAMPVNIYPRPDSVLRIWMLFEEHLEGDTTTVTEPMVTPLKRKGFTVVEWGGMVR